jgi:SAM-dependent methyltransferase
VTTPTPTPPSAGSNRWRDLAGAVDGDVYAARFEQLAAAGADVHGEATLCASLVPPGSRVLDAGCGTGRVAIRLAELGYVCVGVDTDASMLSTARRSDRPVRWVQGDLADLGPVADELGGGFDLVVAAGNVIPLLAAGSEAGVVTTLARLLHRGGLLVAGFGLDVAHLPLDFAPVDLPSYDGWCAAAGLVPVHRFATWDGQPYGDGGYAVSVHRRR